MEEISLARSRSSSLGIVRVLIGAILVLAHTNWEIMPALDSTSRYTTAA